MPAISKENESKLDARKVRTLFDYDKNTGNLIWKMDFGYKAKKGTVAGRNKRNGTLIQINGISYLARRIVWLHINGSFPEHHIEHINGNNFDNRIENLTKKMSQKDILEMLSQNKDMQAESCKGLDDESL